VIQICSAAQNNPVLIGEPGGGKTAIVEGLARVSSTRGAGDAQNKRLLSLDMASCWLAPVIAERFEERLKSVAQGNRPGGRGKRCFYDELHTMVGAGKPRVRSMRHMLKPALARGSCIASAPPRSTNTANTSRRTPRSSGVSRGAGGRTQRREHDAILRGLQRVRIHHGVTSPIPAIVPRAELSHRYNHRPFPGRQGHRPHRNEAVFARQNGNRLQSRKRWTSSTAG